MKALAPVLLADDDEHDVFFMRRAFQIAEVRNPLRVVTNGQEVIWYLEGRERYGDRAQYPEPGLLLLDLKMPVVDGFEVLSWIRERARWRDHLAVIVLSSSDQESDKRRAFELGAHEYLVKPSFEALIALVRQIKDGWLEPDRARFFFPQPRGIRDSGQGR